MAKLYILRLFFDFPCTTMTLLADLTSKNPERIWASACAIRTLRDLDELRFLAQHLAEIAASVRDVKLGGALRPNASHVNFALRKLRYVQSASGCLCALYPEDDLFDPNQEHAAGHVVIHTIRYIDNKWVDYYDCECCICGKHYRVEEREYHYTWWAWQLV